MPGARKGTYKIRSWSTSNGSLVRRGSVSGSARRPSPTGSTEATPRPGHPFLYSDTAIECLLVLRELLKRLYRQIENLARSLAWRIKISRRRAAVPRDLALRQVRDLGRRRWKDGVEHHRRSLSETAMYRMKCSFGGRLKNRRLPNQRAEVRVESRMVNRFTHLGLPKFAWS